MVIAQGADILPLGKADLVLKFDHQPAAFALGFEPLFFIVGLRPPRDVLTSLFWKSDIVEGKGNVKRVQGGGELLGQARLAKLFCVFPIFWSIDPAKVFFPKLIPGAHDVLGRADACSALPNPKVGRNNIPFERITICRDGLGRFLLGRIWLNRLDPNSLCI